MEIKGEFSGVNVDKKWAKLQFFEEIVKLFC